MDERVLKSLILPIDDGQGNVDDVKYLIPQGTVTEADLEEAEGLKADAIIRNASGAIASFDDGGEDLPVKKLLVSIEPKQSGTGDPSPSNVRPISGADTVGVIRSNKNLLQLKEQESYGINFAVFEDGVYKIKGTATHDFSSSYLSGVGSDPLNILLKGGRTYHFSYTTSIPMSLTCDIKQSNGTVISVADSVTLTEDAVLIAVRMNLQFENGQTYNITIRPQLEIGSTATDYVPYKGETKSITLPQTVYGGTLDVVSGDDKNKMYYIALTGNEGWGESSQYYEWNVASSSTDLPYCRDNTSNSGLCSHFKFGTVASGGNGVLVGTAQSTGKYIIMLKSQINQLTGVQSLAEFKAYLQAQNSANTPVQVAYYLKNDTDFTTTPTEVKSLLGDNNIWADTGDVNVDYRADTSLVINKILEALA